MSQCGTTQNVLAEREIEPNIYEGYTDNYTLVHFHSDKNVCGQIITVTIIKINGNTCIGIIKN